MRGRIRELVIYFKFHENRSRGLGAVGVENHPLPFTRPAYTTACTTINVKKSTVYTHVNGDRPSHIKNSKNKKVIYYAAAH